MLVDAHISFSKHPLKMEGRSVGASVLAFVATEQSFLHPEGCQYVTTLLVPLVVVNQRDNSQARRQARVNRKFGVRCASSATWT